ncbi:tRNA-dihydrouridine(47) synthase [NAD(P)(+)]-like [Lemur catta]|uniref:tRNA-dihydrouridine(47) synthase [NAD(P)(+)]-like n=1 Tax=Lemur catta TaxID=9447 RepID=UPI001E26B046|nr:tRNA-dihydrouridine(47) synthase [NAD(P)(+)]-like [Lemur catta]XP_045404883.1 tRNA-dihydrouridine(47) synthase [NAD(P)(+)]-like [Lemur catta]XP_045404889.1 tRNA-dihydrouridine(47) synthase [NAD(P)(+)]-like [Lemur catta]
MAEGALEAPAENGGGGGGGDSGASASERGVAPIKPQYLTTKEQFHKFLETKGQEKPCQETETGDPGGNDLAEPEAKRIRLEDGQMQDGQTDRAAEHGEPLPAQKRARGQNKGRPHVKPTHYDQNRLCPSLIQESAAKCFFGDRCRFLHDVGRYLETKPADLGPHCVLFETFGRCPYGVTCRFARAHLGPEGQNLVQKELAARWAQHLPIRNGLDKALQQQLRKRKIRFERSEQILRQLSQGPPPAAAVPEVTAAEGASGQNNCEAPEAPAGLGAGTPPRNPVRTCGPLTDEDIVRLRPCEKKRLDIGGKLYLAPLTTCGNLPFRRICKRFGADVTCGEMAVCTNLLQGQTSEWALLKRHQCEDIFGVQLEGAFPDTMTKCAELLNRTIDVDFVDINVGCPIDLVYKKGGGCALMHRSAKFQQIVRGMNQVLDVPLTVKIRTGVQERVNLAHRLLPDLWDWGAALVTLHGRSREQRYTKLADWQYIEQCVKAAGPMPLFGNGDILSYEDANRAMQTGVAGIMIARGALLKPWLFTEIKEQRHWDISSSERLDILRDFTNYGLEHWGSDTQGVERTRRFLLEWLSFLCRYVPVGLLEQLPQRINVRPPYYLGRDHLETLMASQKSADWIRISEMLLGPVPPNFVFLPKHKANAYK